MNYLSLTTTMTPLVTEDIMTFEFKGFYPYFKSAVTLLSL